MNYAFNYVKANGGINTAASYPYVAKQSTCRNNKALNVAKSTGYLNVLAGSAPALMEAVAKGPVSIAIQASCKTFQQYKSGVYDDTACTSRAVDHGGEFPTIFIYFIILFFLPSNFQYFSNSFACWIWKGEWKRLLACEKFMGYENRNLIF